MDKNRYQPWLLVIIMALLVVLVGGIAVAILYQTAFQEEKARLVDTVKSRARLMEAVARFNSIHNQTTHKEGFLGASIAQIKDAHQYFEGFGKTGEYTLAKRRGELIDFVLSHRHSKMAEPNPVPFSAKLAEPMRRALSGRSGTVVGLDYRGATVLAAYEPVAILDLGVVAKIDIQEIRAPFIRAAAIVFLVGMVAIGLGVFLFLRITKPLLHRLELTQKAMESVSEAIVITNTEAKILDINPAYEQLTGFSRAEVLGKNPNIAQSGRHDKKFYEAMWQELSLHGCWEGEIWDRKKDGTVFPKWLTISVIKNAQGKHENYVGVFTDISEQKAINSKLKSLAFYDQLTQLANRALFNEHILAAIATASRRGSKFSIMFIDLDRFKQVNDTFGHAAGDELLCVIAQRMQASVRGTDTVARLGGDEFAIILTEISNSEEVGHLAQTLIKRVGEPVFLKAGEAQVGASIGITLYPDDGQDQEVLCKHADIAMYQAKEAGRNTFRSFSKELQTLISNRVALEQDLKQAIEANRLSLYYQPKVDVGSGAVFGVEALVRWNRNGEGVMGPAEFIPLAEETGLIVPMGEWVLTEACEQGVRWAKVLATPVQIAVNLSARQFMEPNFVEMVKKIVEESQIQPAFLELEITESMVMGDVEEAIDIMNKLRALGVTLAIDDFGTGFSSLNHLKRFPVTTLKIDRSFVQDLTCDPEDDAIVEAVISMAKSLKLNVVAEGVETKKQLGFLEGNNCHSVQGFFFSKPLPSDELLPLFQKRFEKSSLVDIPSSA
ncbi:MAG: EAL domain-containing protein [Magnetococcales bacterium]|nr:EAL domain-containing protein [Magnetococcales bacterium]